MIRLKYGPAVHVLENTVVFKKIIKMFKFYPCTLTEE